MTAAVAIAAGTAIFGALSAQAQAKSQQKIFERNAQISEQNAIQVEQEAVFEEGVKRSTTQRLKATQRAQQGAAGGGVGTGSNLLVLEETATLGELDALSIRYRGDVAAQRERAQAATERFEGKAAIQTGRLKAVSSLLGGVTRAEAAHRATKGQPSIFD